MRYFFKKNKFIIYIIFFIFISSDLFSKEISYTGKRYALVIGINEYEDSYFRNLSNARNDAKRIAELLRGLGRFQKIELLTDDSDKNKKDYPSRQNIDKKLDNLLGQMYPEDTILLFFSGHGIADEDSNNYLLAADSSYKHRFFTSLKVSDIISKIETKGIKKGLLILDACRNRLSNTKSVEIVFSNQNDETNVLAILYSTRQGLYSYEDKDTGYGVFSRYLIAGLQGDADKDKNTIVTLFELKEFVERKMKEHFLSTEQFRQTPSLSIPKEFYGDLELSFVDVGELSKTHDPMDTEGKSLFKTHAMSTLNGIAYLAIPGYYEYKEGDRNRGVFWIGASFLTGIYLYTQNLGYVEAKENYEEKQRNLFLSNYPGNVLQFGALEENRNLINSYASRTQSASLLLTFLYGVSAIGIWKDMNLDSKTKTIFWDMERDYSLDKTVSNRINIYYRIKF